MKRVQFLQSPTGRFMLAYNAGEYAELPDALADTLVQEGFAELTPAQTTVNTPEKKATPAAQTAASKKPTEKR